MEENVILNDSEESHRRTDRHILLTLVVGYFACAQYDVLFLFVIAREAKRRSNLPGGCRATEYMLYRFLASKQQAGFFGYVHYLPVVALYKEKLPVISAVRYKIHPLVFPDFFHVRFEFFLGEYILAYINV